MFEEPFDDLDIDVPEFYPVPPYGPPAETQPVAEAQFDFFIWEAFSDQTLRDMASVGSAPAKQELKIREYRDRIMRGLDSLLRDASRDMLD